MNLFQSQNPTPEELVSSARTGNEEAFFQLLHQMMPLLKNRSSRYAALAGCEAEDLLQEGAIGLYRAMIAYRPEMEKPFVAFATVCVENSIRSAIRKELRKKRPESERLVSLTDLPEVLPDLSESVNPENMLDVSENVGLIKSVSSTLTPLEKKVLNAFVSGISYREMAEQLRISEKSADNAMQRVRKKVRKQLSALSQNP